MGRVKISPNLINAAAQFLQGVMRGIARPSRQKSGSTPVLAPTPKSSPKPSSSSTTTSVPSRETAAPSDAPTATVLNTSNGLPTFDYAPRMDGDPDPGEIVWTWVPFEEDPTVGKDRPVLVIARLGNDVAAVQMTSKDHDRDAAQEASWGRYWFDIGSGSWDSRGRPSEVRLDRILRVPPVAMRREGGILDKATFDQVTEAIKLVHARG